MRINVIRKDDSAIVRGERQVFLLRQELAKAFSLVRKARRAMGLSASVLQVGQRVTILPDEIQKTEQRGVTFVVSQVVLSGGHCFTSLRAPDGTIPEWFRADELVPAGGSAVTQPPQALAGIAPPTPSRSHQATDGPAQQLIALAHRLSTERRLPYRDALILASKMDPVSVDRYRDQFGVSR